MNNRLFFILYDGIDNSVFQSQVLMPLLTRKKSEPQCDIHIISFEQGTYTLPDTPGITFRIFKRLPFFHRWGLMLDSIRLHFILRTYEQYTLLARGPFAGYIAHKAATSGCKSITVQVRGLAAEEYLYALQEKTIHFLHKLRYRLYLSLEQRLYRARDIIFEAVSPALKEHIIKQYCTPPENITLAYRDIPSIISSDMQQTFRAAKRNELGLDENRIVYCYSGSYKAWQCPQETIEYFTSRYVQDPRSFLLILTTDLISFRDALAKTGLPSTAFCIRSVSSEALCAYLTAADFGLLFRKKHIINTVSRPTKALEYHAAGLTVLHNDTVPYVIEMPNTRSIHL